MSWNSTNSDVIIGLSDSNKTVVQCTACRDISEYSIKRWFEYREYQETMPKLVNLTSKLVP